MQRTIAIVFISMLLTDQLRAPEVTRVPETIEIGPTPKKFPTPNDPQDHTAKKPDHEKINSDDEFKDLKNDEMIQISQIQDEETSNPEFEQILESLGTNELEFKEYEEALKLLPIKEIESKNLMAEILLPKDHCNLDQNLEVESTETVQKTCEPKKLRVNLLSVFKDSIFENAFENLDVKIKFTDQETHFEFEEDGVMHANIQATSKDLKELKEKFNFRDLNQMLYYQAYQPHFIETGDDLVLTSLVDNFSKFPENEFDQVKFLAREDLFNETMKDFVEKLEMSEKIHERILTSDEENEEDHSNNEENNANGSHQSNEDNLEIGHNEENNANLSHRSYENRREIEPFNEFSLHSDISNQIARNQIREMRNYENLWTGFRNFNRRVRNRVENSANYIRELFSRIEFGPITGIVIILILFVLFLTSFALVFSKYKEKNDIGPPLDLSKKYMDNIVEKFNKSNIGVFKNIFTNLRTSVQNNIKAKIEPFLENSVFSPFYLENQEKNNFLMEVVQKHKFKSAMYFAYWMNSLRTSMKANNNLNSNNRWTPSETKEIILKSLNQDQNKQLLRDMSIDNLQSSKFFEMLENLPGFDFNLSEKMKNLFLSSYKLTDMNSFENLDKAIEKYMCLREDISLDYPSECKLKDFKEQISDLIETSSFYKKLDLNSLRNFTLNQIKDFGPMIDRLFNLKNLLQYSKGLGEVTFSLESQLDTLRGSNIMSTRFLDLILNKENLKEIILKPDYASFDMKKYFDKLSSQEMDKTFKNFYNDLCVEELRDYFRNFIDFEFSDETKSKFIFESFKGFFNDAYERMKISIPESNYKKIIESKEFFELFKGWNESSFKVKNIVKELTNLKFFKKLNKSTVDFQNIIKIFAENFFQLGDKMKEIYSKIMKPFENEVYDFPDKFNQTYFSGMTEIFKYVLIFEMMDSSFERITLYGLISKIIPKSLLRYIGIYLRELPIMAIAEETSNFQAEIPKKVMGFIKKQKEYLAKTNFQFDFKSRIPNKNKLKFLDKIYKPIRNFKIKIRDLFPSTKRIKDIIKNALSNKKNLEEIEFSPNEFKIYHLGLDDSNFSTLDEASKQTISKIVSDNIGSLSFDNLISEMNYDHSEEKTEDDAFDHDEIRETKEETKSKSQKPHQTKKIEINRVEGKRFDEALGNNTKQNITKHGHHGKNKKLDPSFFQDNVVHLNI